MKTYKVAVGDKEYIVKLEEVSENESLATSQSAAPVASSDAELVKAPLQGSILRIEVKAGQQVKSGDTILIIEAMKLENEIVAPRDGVIDQIVVKEGQTVNAEDPLYSLK